MSWRCPWRHCGSLLSHWTNITTPHSFQTHLYTHPGELVAALWSLQTVLLPSCFNTNTEFVSESICHLRRQILFVCNYVRIVIIFKVSTLIKVGTVAVVPVFHTTVNTVIVFSLFIFKSGISVWFPVDWFTCIYFWLVCSVVTTASFDTELENLVTMLMKRTHLLKSARMVDFGFRLASDMPFQPSYSEKWNLILLQLFKKRESVKVMQKITHSRFTLTASTRSRAGISHKQSSKNHFILSARPCWQQWPPST